MNKFIILSSILVTFISCKKEKSKEIERVNASPLILVDSLFVDMPGSLLAYEDELIWKEHSRKDGFIHVFDKTTGKEKTSFGNFKGEMEEMITPRITKGNDRELLIYDLNSTKVLYFHLDSVLNGNNTPFNIVYIDENSGYYNLLLMNKDSYLMLGENSSKPFVFFENGEKTFMGHYPIEISDAIDKGSVLDGALFYNLYNHSLLYTLREMSYLSLYEYDNGIIKQKWEKTFCKVNCKISRNRLRAAKPAKYTPSTITLTKDYIVTVEQDSLNVKKYPKKKEEIRKFSKAPNTLFVYDYDMNLLKIVDVDLPILRLASEGNNNEVFFIGVNPEFCIGKCIL
ncbi:hypothetical protein [Bacteroides sp. 224]|uniref:hypothetical protein n=1 Tax=Bacteroides sp. 224 TaxID=2302936 RepID=UPI0013D04076|nr:hypothetical protein [Bacteroides sp. 224]NDV66548.1 hypothetical protein [Bacteroides sp. 224]